VIVVVGVFVALLLTVASGLPINSVPGIGIQCRHALFREFKMIGPVEESFLRLGVGFHDASLE
jgi:hypothetical protein